MNLVFIYGDYIFGYMCNFKIYYPYFAPYADYMLLIAKDCI